MNCLSMVSQSYLGWVMFSITFSKISKTKIQWKMLYLKHLQLRHFKSLLFVIRLLHVNDKNLELVSAIFIKFLLFHQMIALQKLWKMLFISSKKLFCSCDIHFFVFLSFPLFLPVTHCFGGWSKINLKVHDIISCLNKNPITHFVWYPQKEKRYEIETLSIDKYQIMNIFIEKSCRKCAAKVSPRPLYNYGK